MSQVQITDETKIRAGRSAHGGIREGQENWATLDRIGSKFRVQARPGAAGCWYKIIFTFYQRGFYQHILIGQIWARGSKVTTAGFYSTF
jgi:hypothetical protein